MAIRKLADNVTAFLSKSAEDYGRIHEASFSQFRFSELVDQSSDSPIEDLFWLACHVQCASASVQVNHHIWVGPNQYKRGEGIHITPQFCIGKYRADFLIEQEQLSPEGFSTPIIVELDGHAFHDKDKHQRSYEKARDREFQRSGYKVLHFTGSDVVIDPYKVAFEALSFLDVYSGTGRDEYNPKDPLGQGY